jgi:hypothetical protein
MEMDSGIIKPLDCSQRQPHMIAVHCSSQNSWPWATAETLRPGSWQIQDSCLISGICMMDLWVRHHAPLGACGVWLVLMFESIDIDRIG